MKLLESTKIKVAKDGKGENMLHLEITEVVLVNFDIFNYKGNTFKEFCIHLFQISHLVNY